MNSLQDGFPVPGRRRIDIRAIALNARAVLGIGKGRFDIPRLLDRLSVVFGVNYDVIGEHDGVLPEGVEACWVPEATTLYIRDSVFVQMCKRGQRAVFTIGHELGHIVLAHRRTANRMSSQPIKTYCNSEWQANCFAAEFTMPLDQINAGQFTDADDLVEAFGVSSVAASIRMQDLTSRSEIKKKPQGVAAPRGF
jgi:hypothetical protein